MQWDLLELIKEFNKNGKLESLIFIFAKNLKISKELICFLNSELDKEKVYRLKFSVIRISNNHIVYIGIGGKVTFAKATISSLRNILSEIKKIRY